MTHVLIKRVYGDFDCPTEKSLVCGDEGQMLSLRDEAIADDPLAKGDDPQHIYVVKKLPDARNRVIGRAELRRIINANY